MRSAQVISCFLGIVLINLGFASIPSERLQSLLQKHQTKIPFKLKFNQIKTVKEMGIDLASEGELEVKKQGFAVWKILKPAYLSIEMSPSEIKIINDPKNPPKIIKKETASAGALEGGDWMKLLMENPENVLKNFNVEELNAKRFKLVPSTPNQGFDSVELQFTATSQIDEVFIQENKDDSLKINFSPAKGK